MIFDFGIFSNVVNGRNQTSDLIEVMFHESIMNLGANKCLFEEPALNISPIPKKVGNIAAPNRRYAREI
jgi:hypothetical protein